MRKKIKIALVSDAIYPYNIGGKEKRIYEISTRLVKNGYSVTIYSMKWWKGENNTVIENGVILKAISPLYPLYSGERRSFKEAILFSLHCFKLIREDFDIIDVDHMPHIVLFPLKIVSLLKRKKMFVTWHEVWGRKYWTQYVGLVGNMAYLVELFSTQMPDKFISNSIHTTRKLRKEFGIKKPIFTIPMGIDLSAISKIRPSSQISDVIFAGRLIKHKHVDILIKSIKLLKKEYPKITCIIVGEGPEEIKLKKLAKDLHLENNIIFLNFLENNHELYALMKSSKVFAFPSTREGFGIVVLEANASGIPVITTNHKDNASRELIVNGNNGMVLELDEKKLAKSITQFLSSDELTRRYINSVKEYDWQTITSKVQEVYFN